MHFIFQLTDVNINTSINLCVVLAVLGGRTTLSLQSPTASDQVALDGGYHTIPSALHVRRRHAVLIGTTITCDDGMKRYNIRQEVQLQEIHEKLEHERRCRPVRPCQMRDDIYCSVCDSYIIIPFEHLSTRHGMNVRSTPISIDSLLFNVPLLVALRIPLIVQQTRSHTH